MVTMMIAIAVKAHVALMPATCSAPRPLATDSRQTVRVCEVHHVRK